MIRRFEIAIQIATSLLFGIFLYLFIARYSLPYTEHGHYFDPESSVVYHDHSVAVYGFLSFLFGFLFMLGFIKYKRRKRNT